MGNSPSSIANNVYETNADVGKTVGFFNVIVSTIICGLFFLVGLYLIFFTSPKRTSTTTGKITNASCTFQGGKSSSYNCNLTISYILGSSTKTTNTSTNSSTRYTVGQSIKLYYDPQNETNIDITSDNYHVIGGIISGISLIVIIISWLWYYALTKSKVLAAIEGTKAEIGAVESIAKMF